MTVSDYDQMYQRQQGRCAICKVPKDPWEPVPVKERQRFLVVDHDHSSGIVRGLLCWHCNCGVGQFRENPAIMFAAAAYLGHEAPPLARPAGGPPAMAAP
jgi:hypothetical protein